MPRTKRRHVRRIGIVAIALLLCCSVLAGIGAAAGPVSYVTVSNVSVSDDAPTVGDTITVTPTIRHSSAGEGGFHVTEVTLADSDGDRLSELGDLGTIGSGETIDAPMRASFSTAGEKRLTVHVRGEVLDANGTVQTLTQLTYPVYVHAYAAASSTKPRVHIDAPDSMVAGTESTVRVTVSNGGDSDLTDVTIRLDDFGDRIDAQTRMRPTIPAGNMTTFTFTVTPSETGDVNLKATLDSASQRATGLGSSDVEALDDTVRVDATTVHRNNSTHLQYHVANAGNAPISDVLVTGRAPDVSLPSASTDRIGASAATTLTVPVDTVPSRASLNVTYTIGGETHRSRQTISPAGLRADATNDTADASSATVAQDALLGGGPHGIPLAGIGLLFGGIAAGGVAGTRFRR
ncbi:hypotheical conserved protein [Halarchaeum acidiphilum MH1-52-1]|uniref:Hypotheical conserved protein n=1 Tax=Halarchaeum acidiphilum MH1-52-1 TaxID=1261545 RepID=U2YSH0_9EURY|nr:CARDB domain-containing protein [Halarchaeum acidiphilum]GAD51692.1 hypotheical conserved protein [Halarchaeum acidiphilum MH1-52-1]